jgi:hypothetical protein
MGVRLALKPWFAAHRHTGWQATIFPADREFFSRRALGSVERTLHFALAAIVIMGWALVYAALTRGMNPPDVARNDRAGTAVSANLGAAPQPPSAAAPAEASPAPAAVKAN